MEFDAIALAGELRLGTWGDGEMAPGGVTSTPFRFRGQYADEETGLSYNFHRYYDPVTGRYLSADPIGLLGGPDVFAYANNCPTSAVDVEGLMYSVIRDKNGNIVRDSKGKAIDGVSGTPFTPHAAVGEGKPCSERIALSRLAHTLGEGATAADVAAKFNNDGYTMETYQGDKEGGTRANPCDICAKMISEIGIETGIGGLPKTPCCTSSCASTSRPSSPAYARSAGRTFRATSFKSCGGTFAVESWPMDFFASCARRVARKSSWLSRASAEARAPAAPRDGCATLERTWWITFSPTRA